MIKGINNLQRIGQEKMAASFLRRLNKPMPAGVSDTTVKAEINHGRWICKCPFCSGAELADKNDKRFFCLSCFNAEVGGKWMKVEYPKNIEKIEAELVKRPKDENRNWTDETLTKLKDENRKAGVE